MGAKLNEHKKWVGWCRDERNNNDKVWSIILVREDDRYGREGEFIDGAYVVAYGRRGKTLQTKLHSYKNAWDVRKLIESKIKKGYKEIPEAELNDVYPDFEDDLDWVEVESKLIA